MAAMRRPDTGSDRNSSATATVYAATDPSGTPAALKLLKEGMGVAPDVRERFLRERLAARSVDHPGVVRVLQEDWELDLWVF